MLKSLFIQNFVLIDSLDIQFDNGFSVITGETGSREVYYFRGPFVGARATGRREEH